MKNYDPNMSSGIHTIKITLQIWDYVGHIIHKVGGNCKGMNVLEFDFECWDGFEENDCHIEYHEDCGYFACVLKNSYGDTLSCGCDANEMNDMIVAIEILDYTEE